MFLAQALMHPFQVAAPCESSASTVAEIVRRTTSTMRKVVVEFGPGPGTVARDLTKKDVLTEDSLIVLIEANKKFAETLRQTIRDPRVRVFHDVAQNVRSILDECGIDKADTIISSIPYSVMRKHVREKIVRETANALSHPDGNHLLYNVNTRKVEKTLRMYFPRMTVTRLEDNAPPLMLYEAFVATQDAQGNDRSSDENGRIATETTPAPRTSKTKDAGTRG